MSIKTLSAEQVHQGSLVLINATHGFRQPLKSDAIMGLSPEVDLEKSAAKMLLALMKTLKAEDEIVYVSGLRSYETQKTLFDETLEAFGEAYTRAFVALPGHSEHQTGLAIDLGQKKAEIDFVCPEFPYEGICQQFRQLAPSYGFIERYPKGKESVTGIAHEPWHFRYVGVPHSEIISAHQFTLEEYHDHLKNYLYGETYLKWHHNGYVFKIAYVPCQSEVMTVEVDEMAYVTFQGNNVDGFVYTEMVSI